MKLIIILSLIFLTACQSPKLYIVNDGYSAEKIQQVKQALTAQGLTVLDAKVSIPQEFSNVALATNIGFSDQGLINQVQAILNQFDLSQADHYRFKQGNHYYTDNNMGIYLKNPQRLVQMNLPPYLTTQNCAGADATLQLIKSGEFVLEYENRPYTDDKLNKLSGRWDFFNDRLTLSGAKLQPQVYQQSHVNLKTHLGLRPADIFEPVTHHNKLAALNCEYSIVYMDQ